MRGGSDHLRPRVLSFKELLKVFFAIHDPTTLNRQGPDAGTQYRSAIFYHTPEQRATAEQVIKELGAAGIWSAPIVTEVTPFTAFYEAEDYHQEYFRLNGEQPYCRAVVAPKVAKFRKQFMERLKRTERRPRIATPVLFPCGLVPNGLGDVGVERIDSDLFPIGQDVPRHRPQGIGPVKLPDTPRCARRAA